MVRTNSYGMRVFAAEEQHNQGTLDMSAESNAVYASPSANLGQIHEEHNEKGFFSFSGRIGRLRYLAYVMGLYLLLILVGGIVGAVMGGAGLFDAANDDLPLSAWALLVPIYLVLLVYGFAFMVRRLNDIGWSGWLCLLVIVPFLGGLFALAILFIPGTDGENKYGMPAGPNTTGIKLLAFLMPGIAIIGIIAAVAVPAYVEYVEGAQQSQQ